MWPLLTTGAGSHTLSFSHSCYQEAETTVTAVAGSTTTVDTVTLLAGDVNGDGCVDVLDVVTVAAQFGQTNPDPPCADVNGDGRVDIVDMVLVAARFGTCQ
jgi:hypothetical protein